MTTWTPSVQQTETWAAETAPKHVFSTVAFSRAFSNGKRVFALGSSSGSYAGVWDASAIQAETWAAE